MRIVNLRNGAVIADRAERADRFLSRLRGLLGRTGLPVGGGLWIEPCNGIHTLGMRFPIDVLFVDGEGLVLRALANLPPWRVPTPVPRCRAVLELPAGTLRATGTREGDRIAPVAGGEVRSDDEGAHRLRVGGE